MLRPLPICFIIGLLGASLYLLFTPHSTYLSLTTYLVGMSPPEWSSNYSGYLQRAQIHPNPHSYPLQRDILTLVGLRNAPTEPKGFSLAVFSDRVAVDMKGQMYVLSQADYDGLLQLAQATGDLPKTGGFRNQWRVRQEITSRPIDRILAAKTLLLTSPAASYEDEFTETSVYGFDKHKVLLQTPVEGYQELPASLWELTGLVLEARATPGEGDVLILERVRRILGNVF